MNKCYCYEDTGRSYCGLSDFKVVGICNGTKERDECHCCGDETMCDFYPDVRERALQNILAEYDFKVGDVVIKNTGEVGIIESVCDCDRCKARGFYEPQVKMADSDDVTYITDYDKSNGFIRFYQIGKYRFGNIDKESVEHSIEHERNNIKEATQRLTEYRKQLKRLNLLESWEKEKKDFVVSIDYEGDLYGFDI